MNNIKVIEIKIFEDGNKLLVLINNSVEEFQYPNPYWNEYKEDNIITNDRKHLLGKRIFENIFVTDERVNHFKTTLNNLKDDEDLIIFIISNSPKALEIPYELMFYENEFILKKSNIHLIRKKDKKNLKIKPSKSVINILYILSLPLEIYEKAPIDPLDELIKIYSALGENMAYVNIKVLESANFENIRVEVTKNSYDIIHFTGHGNRNGLVIEDSEDFTKERLLQGEEIRELFNGLSDTKVVILDTGFTASQNEKYFGQSTVSHFEDIPIVIANQSSISDNFATNEITQIYKALFEPNLKIFNIMKEVRTNSTIDNFNEWWKPVLYLNIDIRETLFEFSEKNEEKRVIKGLGNFYVNNSDSQYIYRYKSVRYILEHLRENKYAILHGIGGAGKSYLADYIIEMLKGQFRHLIGLNLFEIDSLSDIVLEIAEEFADKEIISEAELEEIEEIKRPNKAWLKLQDFIGDDIFLVLDNIDIWLKRGVFKDRENQKFIEDLIKNFNGKILFTSRSAIFLDERKENLLDNLIEIETYSKNDFYSLLILCHKYNKTNFDYLHNNEDNFAKYDYHPLLINEALKYKSENFDELFNSSSDLNEIRDYYTPYFKENRNLQKIALLNNEVSRKFYELFQLEAINSELRIFQKSGDFYNLYGIIKYYARKSFLADEVERNLKELLTIFEEFEIDNPFDALNLIQIYEYFNKEDEKLANIYNKLGSLYQIKGNFSKTLDYYEKALEIQKKVLGENHQDIATNYNNLGSLYQDKGDLPKALDNYKKALMIQKKVLGKYHKDIATSYNNIGGIYQEMGDLSKALEYCEKALQIKEKVLGENHQDTATSYNNIGRIYQDKGDLSKTLDYYEKALEIQKKVLGENHQDTATSYNNIGGIYQVKGDLFKALENYERALQIVKKVLGENHQDTATSYNNTGLLYQAKGNFSKALENYEKALEIQKKVLGENHQDTATSYNNIGNLYQAKGDFSKALENYEKALEMQKKVLGENHLNTAISYNSIGRVYQAKGNFSKALENYEKALEIRKKVLGENHSDTANSYNNIGGIYQAKGDFFKALQYYQKSLEIQEKVLGENHQYTASSYNNIGGVYQSKGNLSKALENYEKALKILKNILGENHEYTASSYNNIASLYENMENITKALEYAKRAYLSLENTQNYFNYFGFYVYYLQLKDKNQTLEKNEFCEMFRKFEDLMAYYNNQEMIINLIFYIEPIFDKYECDSDMVKKLKPIIDNIRKQKNSNN